MQALEVVVPEGVVPGEGFTVPSSSGHATPFFVTCPQDASPGQTMRFILPPVPLVENKDEASSSDEDANHNLKHNNEVNALPHNDRDGWYRAVSVPDLRFRWVRQRRKNDNSKHSNKVVVDSQPRRFDWKSSAYVRHLSDSGQLSLLPADDVRATVDSTILSSDRTTEIASYADIANVMDRSFEEKAAWFRKVCLALSERGEDAVRIKVRRDHLLEDSIGAVMKLGPEELRRIWRFEFEGEVCGYESEMAREWFQCVTEEMFDRDLDTTTGACRNLWDRVRDPASEGNLVRFRFLGRFLGKALFDGQILVKSVVGHMIEPLYKLILRWPLTVSDLELIDEDCCSSIKQIAQMAETDPDQVEYLCLDFATTDFATTETNMGERKEVLLVPNGDQVEVDSDNLHEYFEALFNYKLVGSVKAPLTELLLGFFDVIPEPILLVFDFRELEFLMFGLPHIDVEDWRDNAEYSGEYERVGMDHETCRWFWEVVEEEFDDEMRARLLQFVTGTSCLPSRGFGALKGSGGDLRRFTIHGVELGVSLYPRAHKCFNTIDLPMYETKEELKERLKVAVKAVSTTGFDIK